MTITLAQARPPSQELETGKVAGPSADGPCRPPSHPLHAFADRFICRRCALTSYDADDLCEPMPMECRALPAPSPMEEARALQAQINQLQQRLAFLVLGDQRQSVSVGPALPQPRSVGQYEQVAVSNHCI